MSNEKFSMTTWGLADDVLACVSPVLRPFVGRERMARVIAVSKDMIPISNMQIAGETLLPARAKSMQRAMIQSVRWGYKAKYGLDPMTWLLIARLVLALIRWWMKKASNQDRWASYLVS